MIKPAPNYIIYGLMPEVPEGHMFASNIENLQDHPELWKEECPYTIRNIEIVNVEKLR
jgi:hypothetical protein